MFWSSTVSPRPTGVRTISTDLVAAGAPAEAHAAARAVLTLSWLGLAGAVSAWPSGGDAGGDAGGVAGGDAGGEAGGAAGGAASGDDGGMSGCGCAELRLRGDEGSLDAPDVLESRGRGDGSFMEERQASNTSDWPMLLLLLLRRPG